MADLPLYSTVSSSSPPQSPSTPSSSLSRSPAGGGGGGGHHSRAKSEYFSPRAFAMPASPPPTSAPPAPSTTAGLGMPRYRPGHRRAVSSISMRYTPIQYQAAFATPPGTDDDDDEALLEVPLDDEGAGGSNASQLPPPPRGVDDLLSGPLRRSTMPTRMVIPPPQPQHFGTDMSAVSSSSSGSGSGHHHGLPSLTMPALSSSRSSTPTSALPTPLPWSFSGAGVLGHSRHTSLEHPPGYIQDVRAAELTSDQRRAREIEEDRVRRESSGNVFEALSETMSLMGTGYDGLGGGGATKGAVWGAAKRFSISASKTFEVMEKEAWRLMSGGSS